MLTVAAEAGADDLPGCRHGRWRRADMRHASNRERLAAAYPQIRRFLPALIEALDRQVRPRIRQAYAWD
jgi:hypothetical protein